MSGWKEHHYARAAEFVRLLDAALGPATKAPPVASPTPPAKPPAAPAVESAPPAPAAKPTAASVFKSIPWKK